MIASVVPSPFPTGNPFSRYCRFLSAGKNQSGLSKPFEPKLTNKLIEADVDRNDSLYAAMANVVKPGRSLTYPNAVVRLGRFLSAGKNQSGLSKPFEPKLTNKLIEADVDRNDSLYAAMSNVVKPAGV